MKKRRKERLWERKKKWFAECQSKAALNTLPCQSKKSPPAPKKQSLILREDTKGSRGGGVGMVPKGNGVRT